MLFQPVESSPELEKELTTLPFKGNPVTTKCTACDFEFTGSVEEGHRLFTEHTCWSDERMMEVSGL